MQDTNHPSLIHIFRGRSPKERAQAIIENCVHPDYKNILWDYLKLTDGKSQDVYKRQLQGFADVTCQGADIGSFAAYYAYLYPRFGNIQPVVQQLYLCLLYTSL